MSKKRDCLNNCLERLSQGEELESCLKDHPEEAGELRLLLTTVGGIKQYAGTIKLHPEFITQTQANLEKAYEGKYFSWQTRIAGVLRPAGRLAAITAIAIVVLVFVFTGSFTLSVLASEDTMPGQTLYPVKLATLPIKAFNLSLVGSDYEAHPRSNSQRYSSRG
jgi:hypothetical protein